MKRAALKAMLPILAGLAFLILWSLPVFDPDYTQDAQDAKKLPVDEFLVDRLNNGAERIYLNRYYLSYEAFQEIWQTVLYDHPELFYVSSGYQYASDNTKILHLEPEYTMDENTRSIAKADYALAVEDILRNVDPRWSDLETALYLHDWIALNCAYDEAMEHHSAYDLFTLGTGVCQSYAQAYLALLTECGIPCRFVISEEMEHAWVIVQLDGEWYHVDVTHDDPVFDRLGHVSHTYFLLSDNAVSQDHHGGIVPYPCTSSRYDDDAPWSDIGSAFVPIDGVFYCVSGNQVCRWDEDGFSPLYTVREVWYADSPYSYWEGCFSSLATDGTNLLFNTPKTIMRYDLTSGKVSTLYTYDGPGDLYGFTYTDHTATCQISASPNEAGTTLTVELP